MTNRSTLYISPEEERPSQFEDIVEEETSEPQLRRFEST